MTKNKHHGTIINQQYIKNCFNKYNFFVDEIVTYNNYFKVYISKDYSKDFNIKFDGLIKLEVIISPQMYDCFCVFTYPKFKEISNKIPKKPFYHIYSDGSLCYAPPKRPLDENWKLTNFINAVDALLYNYFSIEYIGKGDLFELEHGYKGLKQYEFIFKNNFLK